VVCESTKLWSVCLHLLSEVVLVALDVAYSNVWLVVCHFLDGRWKDVVSCIERTLNSQSASTIQAQPYFSDFLPAAEVCFKQLLLETTLQQVLYSQLWIILVVMNMYIYPWPLYGPCPLY
jgi:hypothetical protein